MTSSWSTKRHLDVELGELRLPVGAEVLVAVAARDLVVALHAADHQQLLEQLRALRQRVPGARTQPRRHQEVAGTLGGGAGQRRGLDLDELAVVQHRAGGVVDLAAQAHRGGRAGAAQVEVAVRQAHLLPHLDVVVDGERQRRAGAEDLDVGRDDLDVAGRQVRVLVALGAGGDLAGDRDAGTPSAAGAPRSSSRTTTWATPLASRRSRKATPPWSRRRATQPARVTVWPTCSARRAPASWVRITGFSFGSLGGPVTVRGCETTWGRRSWAGGAQVPGSASTWSPLRMSLTWWAVAGRARVGRGSAGNHTNGMPRRSAYRICLPKRCADGRHLAGDAARAQRGGDGVGGLAGVLVGERHEHGGGHLAAAGHARRGRAAAPGPG